jgi:ferredoxin
MIPLYYFSASGNTKYCSELVQRGFQDRGISIELIRIKTVRNLPFPDKNKLYPAIGLAFPIYEFMIPRIVLIWLYQLPIANQTTPIFIIDTSGGLPCNSAEIAMNLLQKKNYDTMGILEVPTPTGEPFLDNKYYRAGWSQEILNRCYYFGALIAKKLREENNQLLDLRLGRFRFPKLTNYMYQYILQGQSSSKWLIRFDPSKCNKCGACERKCPMAAIDTQKFPDLINLNRCMFCATCIRTCPFHAIMISYRTKKIPPSATQTTKSRPGYIDPKRFEYLKKPNLNMGYIRFSLNMMRVKKILRNIKTKS